MKKKAYKTVDVKKVNVDALSEKVNGQSIVLSIDVAKIDFVASIMTSNKEVLLTLKWKHPSESLLLIELMLKKLRWHSLVVVMEPSGTYGDSLRAQFLGHGIDVYRVSPKRSHDAAEVYDGVPSMHDAKASAIIGYLHLEGFSELWPMPDEDQRTLTAAIRTMEMYDDAYYRNINRLEALTMRYWPELSSILSLQSATLLELLIGYGCPDHVEQNRDEAEALMKKVGGVLLKDDKVQAVLTSAAASLGVKSLEAERLQVQELCREIRRLQQQRRHAQQQVEALTQDVDGVKAMSPVLGKVTAAVIYLAVGGMDAHSGAGSVVKALGLNLKERSSGKHKGQLRITKRGSGSARMYLYMAALRLIQSDTIIKAWYSKKISRDGGMKMKAIVAIMRKLAAALWHVGKGVAFDASKLFDTRRLALN
jgi:transposase